MVFLHRRPCLQRRIRLLRRLIAASGMTRLYMISHMTTSTKILFLQRRWSLMQTLTLIHLLPLALAMRSARRNSLLSMRQDRRNSNYAEELLRSSGRKSREKKRWMSLRRLVRLLAAPSLLLTDFQDKIQLLFIRLRFGGVLFFCIKKTEIYINPGLEEYLFYNVLSFRSNSFSTISLLNCNSLG